jgi:hypothetical protein
MATLVAYRLSDWDTPLPPSPSRSDARFHRAGGRIAHYWSMHPHGPWAELLRADGIRLPDPAEFRKRLWVVRIDADPLRVGFDEAHLYGIAPTDLIADDHDACRDLADRLAAGGTDAINVPSAALPGVENLVLLGDRVQADYLPAVIDAAVDVPSAAASDDGAPPPGPGDLVRHFGDPHAALEAWRANESYLYTQPPAPRRVI